jgi:hypothetical protein
MSYSFFVGIFFLYISAFFLVRLEISPGYWYGYTYIFGSIIIMLALYIHFKTTKHYNTLHFNFTEFDYLLLFAIILIVVTLGYINIVNPVIDSDATQNYIHVGLAKYLFWQYPLSETNAYKGSHSTELSPPILHAFVNMLQDRWHDSIATIHYFFIFIWILLLVFFTGIRNNVNIRLSLIAVFLIASIPISIVHAIRPGYGDMLSMIFFMLSISVLINVIYTKNISKLNLFLIFVSILGGYLSKMEWLIWGLWLVVVILSLYFNFYKNILWKKILFIQGVLLVVAFILYLLSAEWVYNNIDLPKRLSWMFDLQYNPASFERFFSYMFSVGGQGLIWWIYIISSLVLLIRSKNPTYKAITLYSFFLVLGVFYFSNFTFNITFTLQGTNVGRFFLQLAPLVILSYYLMILDIKYSNKK